MIGESSFSGKGDLLFEQNEDGRGMIEQRSDCFYILPQTPRKSRRTLFKSNSKMLQVSQQCRTIEEMVKSKKSLRNGIDRFWKVVKIRCWRRRTGSYWQPRQTRVTKSVQHLTIQNFKPQTWSDILQTVLHFLQLKSCKKV